MFTRFTLHETKQCVCVCVCVCVQHVSSMDTTAIYKKMFFAWSPVVSRGGIGTQWSPCMAFPKHSGLLVWHFSLNSLSVRVLYTAYPESVARGIPWYPVVLGRSRPPRLQKKKKSHRSPKCKMQCKVQNAV